MSRRGYVLVLAANRDLRTQAMVRHLREPADVEPSEGVMRWLLVAAVVALVILAVLL